MKLFCEGDYVTLKHGHLSGEPARVLQAFRFYGQVHYYLCVPSRPGLFDDCLLNVDYTGVRESTSDEAESCRKSIKAWDDLGARVEAGRLSPEYG